MKKKLLKFDSLVISPVLLRYFHLHTIGYYEKVIMFPYIKP